MPRPPLALILCISLSALGHAQSNSPVSDVPDHVTSFGPDKLGDQIRYLTSSQPYDFMIGIATVVGKPRCNEPGDEADCEIHITLDELLIGHLDKTTDWGRDLTVLYRHDGSKSDQGFKVRNGNKIVVMLTPKIRVPKQSNAYIATRLDHFTDRFVESVRTSIADLLASAHCESKP